jgi:hypothetical protein
MLSHPGASAPSRFCIIPEKRGHEFRTSSLIHLFITDDLDQPYRLLMALRSQQVRPSDHRVYGNASGDQKAMMPAAANIQFIGTGRTAAPVNEKKNTARRPAKMNGTG